MALSVRSCLNCLGVAGNASVVQDLFGYGWVPRALSLRRQVELVNSKHLDLNIILVGYESLNKKEYWDKIYGGIQVMREIYGQVDLGIGKLHYYGIHDSDAGGYAVPNKDQAHDLTDHWIVHNWALDVFVVRDAIGFAGRSAVGGRCTKDSKYKMNGIVVRLSDTDVADVGNTFAHEAGHYMDLEHVSDANNFIGSSTDTEGDSDSWTGITTAQGNTMKNHCLIQAACPG